MSRANSTPHLRPDHARRAFARGLAGAAALALFATGPGTGLVRDLTPEGTSTTNDAPFLALGGDAITLAADAQGTRTSPPSRGPTTSPVNRPRAQRRRLHRRRHHRIPHRGLRDDAHLGRRDRFRDRASSSSPPRAHTSSGRPTARPAMPSPMSERRTLIHIARLSAEGTPHARSELHRRRRARGPPPPRAADRGVTSSPRGPARPRLI